MTTNKFGDKLEELNLSHEEIDRLTKCMKDEKFRDLLKEYAEEISDPENRKRYEEEIAMLEKDRGMDVKFINPKPGHVLKTSINGNQKCFINICTNENLGQPRSRPSMQGNTRGMQWSIPHSVSQAREDVDKAGTKCMVYDVVFHPDTYYLLKKNARFKKMIHDTALDAVERQFGVELDKVNIRTPKMTFKGLPMSSVIRTPHANGPPDPKDSPSLEDVDVRLRPPHPEESKGQNGATNGTTSKPKPTVKAQPFPNLKEEVKKAKQMRERARNGEPLYKDSELEWGYIEPEYSIMHRGHFDIQNYRLAPDMVYDTWPKELVINIDLPLLSAANCVNLEIFERRLHLDSVKPAKYKLDFELPYPVAENKGFAKFDKSRHRLTVTLEVLPAPPPPKLLPFTSPPLVEDISSSSDDKENKPTVNGESIVLETEYEKPRKCLNRTSSCKVGIEESVSVIEFNEATEATAETLITESTPTAKTKTSKKDKSKSLEGSPQPRFVEEGRRHYQQGKNWRDDDDLEDDNPNTESTKIFPLTKNSAFLIDMVMKYDGLIRRCPQYAFQQDEHFVSFIIEVPHIFEESLWYAIYDNMLQFCCLSECLDDDMVNSVFQLWIEFDQGCRIDPQRSRVDVSGNNAVFCLRKIQSHNEWHVIKAGFDKDNLDVRRFSTARNVCELYTLVYKHAIGVKTSPLAVCKVVREEKNLLILELEAKKSDVQVMEASKPDENQANRLSPDTDAKLIGNPESDASGIKVLEKNCENDEVSSEEKTKATNNAERDSLKRVSFAEDVKKNAERKEEDQSTNQNQDSDDEEPIDDKSRELQKKAKEALKNPAAGLLTIGSGENADDKEVIVDHATKSAVQLSADSLIYELDDDV
ncbi:protein kintoun-like [Clavelina lepadiformis]|uniref:protein kintoun-like n=1 Tax=Clavelina lepadiformis TaxID=159417 RepID=UPI004043526C